MRHAIAPSIKNDSALAVLRVFIPVNSVVVEFTAMGAVIAGHPGTIIYGHFVDAVSAAEAG
jgi:hypothetical protein